MSPTAACPASYPYRPGRIPSLTTPVIPGSRVSSAWTIMSQIEVPITTTYVPGASTPTPGTDTQASTLPTATATSSDSFSFFATSGRSVPAFVPSGTNESPSFSPGWSNPG
jgi:hypothetical protein